MYILLTLLAALVTVFAVNRATRGSALRLADGLLGLLGSGAGLILAQFLSAERMANGLALPLVLACCFTLAFMSIRLEAETR